MALVSRAKVIILHPLTRGMVAYSILWPCGSVIQETISGKRWGKLMPPAVK